MTPTLRNILASLALATVALAPLVADAAIKVDGKPKIAYFADGSPGFLSIEGDSNTMTATDDGTKLSFTVPMTSVKTGIDLRDDHMNNEYVEVAKYPNAILSMAKADVKWPANAGEKTSGTVKATFNIHGVDQPVDVTYTLNHTSKGYTVKANFAFDCAKSGINIPSYMGITVDPKMKAEITTDLIDG